MSNPTKDGIFVARFVTRVKSIKRSLMTSCNESELRLGHSGNRCISTWRRLSQLLDLIRKVSPRMRVSFMLAVAISSLPRYASRRDFCSSAGRT